MWAPNTNYRSACQLKGPLPTAKPLDDIIKGVDRAVEEMSLPRGNSSQ